MRRLAHTICPPRRRLYAAALLVFALLILTVAAFPAKFAPTRYWIAILVVDKNAFDRDAFNGPLHELDFEISKLFHDDKRCIWGKTSSLEQACNERGKILSDCEAIELHWSENHAGHLSLWVEEIGASPENPPMGMIYEHDCVPDATFSDCFTQHLTILAEEVHKHDQMCHPGGKCLVENKHFKPKHP
jgi:hypothetical protein